MLRVSFSRRAVFSRDFTSLSSPVKEHDLTNLYDVAAIDSGFVAWDGMGGHFSLSNCAKHLRG